MGSLKDSLIILIISLLVISCQGMRFAQKADVSVISESTVTKNSPGNDFSNYATDSLHPEYTPMRYVRVNFHFVQPTDKRQAFTKDAARAYVKELLFYANDRLLRNAKMNLPLGNHTAVLPIRVQYVLTPDSAIAGDDGIYFHTDDKLCYNIKNGQHANLYSNQVYARYGNQKGKVINVFMLEHDPDSIKSKTYRATADGIGEGEWAKIIASYQLVHDTIRNPDGSIFVRGAMFFSGLFNHELGHCMGLSHTWNQNDGCDDTPMNPGCWNYTESGACKTQVSNNVMDYNAYQNAYSPCQIAKIQYNFSQENSIQRKFLVPNWCTYKKDSLIIIPPGETVVWNSSKDMEGDIIIGRNATLTIQSTLSMPPGSGIFIKSHGQLVVDGGIITNRCGEQWMGIEVQGSGEAAGQIIFKNGGKVDRVVHGVN